MKGKYLGVREDNATRFALIEKNIKLSFGKIKEEVSDHLDSINQNTNEIQSNYEYLCEIDSKIDKLSERIDELTMFFKQQQGIVEEEHTFEVSPLTKKEKEVFLAMYTLEEDKGTVTYSDISRRIAVPTELVQAYVTNLIHKGVPIVKRYISNIAYLKLDDNFKVVQAKKNILGLDESVSENMITPIR